MNNYTFNYPPDEVPNMSATGLHPVLADANLPTQMIGVPSSAPKVDALDYSPVLSEYDTHNNGANVFTASPRPAAPSLWSTVANAVYRGNVKRGSVNVASGSDTADSSGGGSSTTGAPNSGSSGGSGGGGGMRSGGGTPSRASSV